MLKHKTNQSMIEKAKKKQNLPEKKGKRKITEVKEDIMEKNNLLY